uniref:DnaJ homolog subfamily B member 7 n=1 Tax=Rhizophora mucronata TaxID=61149 RepID=A0A2P2LBP5_RHIMU
MAGGDEKGKSKDFYEVLGLEKECTASELRNAYKRLAMRWHPDRCSSSGNSKFVEESKKKFQAIQQAYSGTFNQSSPTFLSSIVLLILFQIVNLYWKNQKSREINSNALMGVHVMDWNHEMPFSSCLAFLFQQFSLMPTRGLCTT